MKGLFAGVIINRLALDIDRIFHYKIPQHLVQTVTVGSHVIVPFGGGNHEIDGFVLSVTDNIEFDGTVKEISDCKEAKLFDADMLETCDFLRRHYFCSYISALKTVLPPGSTQKRPSNEKFIQGSVLALSQNEAFDALESVRPRAPKQAQVLELLIQNEFVADADIVFLTGASYSTLAALRKKGWIQKQTAEVFRMPMDFSQIPRDNPPTLLPEQKAAVNAVCASADREQTETFLLHGVTGSGKTEVFLHCISHILQQGRRAIVLVPEISLTPQMTGRFAARFGDRIAVLHSGLSLGERTDEYRRIQRGEADVVIGARSAIFAPIKNLGIIIIDEEHEQSYKAENVPAYDAREVATYLAKKHNSTLILASATPAIEDRYRAEKQIYSYLPLKNRANHGQLPQVTVSDMRKEMTEGNRSCIGMDLARELKKNMDAGQQSILFLNRRGFSSMVSCRNCGYVIKCKNCDISMTYHKNRNYLTCHYCGHTKKLPETCPKCQSRYLKLLGTGTQRIEEELQTLFPSATIIRMDTDTTTQKSSHRSLLERFQKEKTDILLGTQMIAKGLDFENVTLVGVLCADQSLSQNSFRANERAFDLMTQVCGRAGRGKLPGRCIIQTYMPDDDTINYAKKQDYEGFYRSEIAVRQSLLYPPFCDMVSLTFTGEEKDSVFSYAQSITHDLAVVLHHSYSLPFEILGPSPASIFRRGGQFIVSVWVKLTLNNSALEILLRLRNYHIKRKESRKIHLIVENNPHDS